MKHFGNKGLLKAIPSPPARGRGLKHWSLVKLQRY